MRERMKAVESDPAVTTMKQRVLRYRAEAGTLIGMGFDEAAAIHALHTKGGQVDA
mgnify:CR=1 FL=1